MASSSGKTRRFDERLPQIRSAAAGIDVGGSEIWVDVGSRDPEPVRKFATFTADLHELADWLNHCGIDTSPWNRQECTGFRSARF